MSDLAFSDVRVLDADGNLMRIIPTAALVARARPRGEIAPPVAPPRERAYYSIVRPASRRRPGAPVRNQKVPA